MLSITSVRQLPVQVVTAVGVIAASAAGGAAHAQTKIVEGIVSHGALQWPEYAAIEFGWFKENGVDLDMVKFWPEAPVSPDTRTLWEL